MMPASDAALASSDGSNTGSSIQAIDVVPDFLSDAALEQAANWYAKLRDSRSSDTDRLLHKQWLLAQPEHTAAWQLVQSISGSFSPLQALPNPEMAAVNLEAANQRI